MVMPWNRIGEVCTALWIEWHKVCTMKRQLLKEVCATFKFPRNMAIAEKFVGYDNQHSTILYNFMNWKLSKTSEGWTISSLNNGSRVIIHY